MSCSHNPQWATLSCGHSRRRDRHPQCFQARVAHTAADTTGSLVVASLRCGHSVFQPGHSPVFSSPGCRHSRSCDRQLRVFKLALWAQPQPCPQQQPQPQLFSSLRCGFSRTHDRSYDQRQPNALVLNTAFNSTFGCMTLLEFIAPGISEVAACAC